MNVKILTTCRKAELLRGTTLVFDSLRVGFPNANVTVFDNALPKSISPQDVARIHSAFERVGATVECLAEQTIHHEWIQGLLETETEPFYICDTDMAFWKSCEGWDFKDAPLAGRYTPQYFDDFTNCITRARLHTSLLYLNPVEIRQWTEKYFAQFPDTPFNPKPNLIYPGFVPVRNGRVVNNYFHDTCCLLYQAIGGQAFNQEQAECYDHMHFGTISDIVAPHFKDHCFREEHFAIFEKPELLRGQHRRDETWYAKRRA